MPITLNDCFTNADLPSASSADAGAPGAQVPRRPNIVDAQEADQLVAAFLASGHRIKTYPPAYAAKSLQYRVPEPPAPAH